MIMSHYISCITCTANVNSRVFPYSLYMHFCVNTNDKSVKPDRAPLALDLGPSPGPDSENSRLQIVFLPEAKLRRAVGLAVGLQSMSNLMDLLRSRCNGY